MARTVTLQNKSVDPVGAPDFTLPVSILAQVIESLRVDIAAQSIPLLNIKLASVGDVTLNVSITGTPTVNIQTSGGANIVIDKLTQGAYTERQSTLANNGAAATMAYQCLYYKRGKFFPRGCRGFIRSIEIYCDNDDTVSHTFTIKLSPMPGMGPVAAFTLSVAGGSSAAWRTVYVNRFWNYDSLFIWVISDSDSYGGLGYDTGAPHDYYSSTDEVSWGFGSYRFWFRVNMTGETVGDLPVSGTVNTIEVPASATFMQGSEKLVPNDTETSLVTVYGSGSIVEMGVVFYTATAPGGAVMYLLYAYADGQLAGIWSNVVATQSSTATSGRCPVGIFVQRSADTTLVFWIPLKFRRSFELRCKQTTGSSCTAYGRVIVNMIA
jgi:hypothetical protein